MIKYPSTPHLPWSPGLQNDDRRIETLDGFWTDDETPDTVIVTEKMDGENTTMYFDRIHARSLDSRHHPSRDWVKGFWGRIRHQIPVGWRVCGENVYARHSIAYDDLESYFYGFSVWDDHNVALAWDDTLDFFKGLGIVPAPTLYHGEFSEFDLRELADDLDLEKQEGYVVRVDGPIPFSEFHLKCAKWVRKGHVQTDEHWMTQAVVPNKLRSLRAA